LRVCCSIGRALQRSVEFRTDAQLTSANGVFQPKSCISAVPRRFVNSIVEDGMAKKLMLLVLLLSLTALAQHGRGGGAGAGAGGMGGPPAGMGGMSGMGGQHGMGGGRDMRSTHDMGAGRNSQTNTSAGPKSPDQLLQQNSRLASRLKDLGVSSCAGFKNLGQCVAAAHVSRNLGIDFNSLKSDMSGGMSLGQAIHKLDPNANAKQEAGKAKKQAQQDLRETQS
jgi:hypothetical protein